MKDDQRKTQSTASVWADYREQCSLHRGRRHVSFTSLSGIAETQTHIFKKKKKNLAN